MRSVRADEPAIATPAVARPLFRPGLVEQAAEERDVAARLAGDRAVDRPVESSSNGLDADAQRPRPDRPRRTHPLRAT